MMNKGCTVDNCEKPTVAFGFCSKHYTRFKRYGDVNFPGVKGGGRPTKIKFEISDNGCFVLTSHKLNSDGYAEIRIRGRANKIHRHIYEQCFGDIPRGFVIRHKCDNPSCINPEHLEFGTHQDNVNDMISRDRHAKGSRKPQSKLKEADVVQIKRLIAKGKTNRNIATLFGIDESIISKIKHNKAWKHVSNWRVNNDQQNNFSRQIN